MATKQNERPDLTAWRARHELRRSSAASPVASGKKYRRKEKNRRAAGQRDGF